MSSSIRVCQLHRLIWDNPLSTCIKPLFLRARLISVRILKHSHGFTDTCNRMCYFQLTLNPQKYSQLKNKQVYPDSNVNLPVACELSYLSNSCKFTNLMIYSVITKQCCFTKFYINCDIFHECVDPFSESTICKKMPWLS